MDAINPIEKLRAVVGYMPGWGVETDNEWMSFLRHQESGTGLRVSHHRGQWRFAIAVDWPRDFNGAYRSGISWGVIDHEGRELEMTVAMNRPAKALATDILRRIGDDAIPLSLEVQEKRQERVARADKARALAEQTAQLLGVETPEVNSFQRYRFSLYGLVGPGYGDVEIYDDSPYALVELKGIDAELTLKIVETIAAHWQARRAR